MIVEVVAKVVDGENAKGIRAWFRIRLFLCNRGTPATTINEADKIYNLKNAHDHQYVSKITLSLPQHQCAPRPS